MHRFPPFKSLQAFETFVRTGSLRGAATELNVTEGAISRQLTQLQKDLGISLYSRIQGKLVVTPEGKAFASQIGEAIDRMTSAVHQLEVNSAHAPLRIACLPTFLNNWLLPRIASLRNDNPELNIEFVTTIRTDSIELVSSSLDALIDVGRWPQDKELIFSSFMKDVSGPVFSKSYLEKVGPIRTVKDLEKASYLAARSRPNMLQDWSRVSGNSPLPMYDIQKFDHAFMCIEAMKNGLGFTIASRCYAKEGLDTGSLVAPLGMVEREIPFYVAWSKINRNNLRIKQFVEWLKKAGDF